jgi:hypothetical protein
VRLLRDDQDSTGDGGDPARHGGEALAYLRRVHALLGCELVGGRDQSGGGALMRPRQSSVSS